jgi:hypothetical protein
MFRVCVFAPLQTILLLVMMASTWLRQTKVMVMLLVPVRAAGFMEMTSTSGFGNAEVQLTANSAKRLQTAIGLRAFIFLSFLSLLISLDYEVYINLNFRNIL